MTLYRFILYFPNLKLVNLQLEQYLSADIPLYHRDGDRLEESADCQDVLSHLHYKTEIEGSYWDITWLQGLILSSVVLNGKVELRLSFEAILDDPECYDAQPVAVFSSNDFCVRIDYHDSEWTIKQPGDEQDYREKVLKQEKKSSFEGLPEGLQALMRARARNKN